MGDRLGTNVIVLSDTHLNELTPQLEELYEKYIKDADMVVHAGDVTSQVVLDYLSQKPLKAVAGNMDPFEIQENYPAKMEFQVESFRFGLIHGWGAPWDLANRVLREFENVQVIIFGHSHQPYCQYVGDVLLFNPGAINLKKKGSPIGSVGIIEVSSKIEAKIIRV